MDQIMLLAFDSRILYPALAPCATRNAIFRHDHAFAGCGFAFSRTLRKQLAIITILIALILCLAGSTVFRGLVGVRAVFQRLCRFFSFLGQWKRCIRGMGLAKGRQAAGKRNGREKGRSVFKERSPGNAHECLQ